MVSLQRAIDEKKNLQDKLFTRRYNVKTTTVERFNLTAVIWREEDQFVSHCPELGVASCGKLPDEAAANLKEAVELYLKNAAELDLLDDLLLTLSATQRYTTSFSVNPP